MGENVWRRPIVAPPRHRPPYARPRWRLDAAPSGRLAWREQPQSDGSARSCPTRAAGRGSVRDAAGCPRLRMLPEREDVVTFETAPSKTTCGSWAGRGARARLDQRRPRRRHLGQALRRGAGRDGLQPDEPRTRRCPGELSRRRPRRQLLRPGRVYALRFENLIREHVPRGHRLRLVVCGAFFPHFSPPPTGALEMVSRHPGPTHLLAPLPATPLASRPARGEPLVSWRM